MTRERTDIKRTITGWKLRVFAVENPKPVNGDMSQFDHTLEYGNSPVRDLKSRTEKIQELMREDREYSLTPIFKEEVDEIVRKATGTSA